MSSKFHRKDHQSEYRGEKEIKLSQSEVDRMVQEAEKFRDEDKVLTSRSTRPRVVWINSALLCETHRLRENPLGRSRAVTDTDEDMDRILITDDSHVKCV